MLMYFNRGQRLLTRHPNDVTSRYNWEFFAVLSGEAAPYYSSDHGDTPCASALWLSPPGATYAWWNEGTEIERVVFHFSSIDLSLAQALDGGKPLRILLDETSLARVRAIADAIEPHYQSPTRFSSLVFSHARAELSLLVAEKLGEDHGEPSLITRRQSIAHRALAFYEGQLPRRAKIAEVARVAGVSAPQLRRIFHEAFDSAPKHLFSSAQLEHAKTLAADSDLIIADIAKLSGFVSASHLCQAFRRKYGVTFLRWRTQLASLRRRPHLRSHAFTNTLEAAPKKILPIDP